MLKIFPLTDPFHQTGKWWGRDLLIPPKTAMLKLVGTWSHGGQSWWPLNYVNGSHYVVSEINFPEPSAPPDPIYNPEVNPYSAELPYPEINPSPTELPYPDGNPCVVDLFSVVFRCHRWVAGSLPAQNGDAVVQHW